MKVLDLFAGIGGFSLAAKFLDWESTDMVEIDPFCQQILKKNFPNARIHSDILVYQGTRGSHDIITGGFPCQDVSYASSQRVGLKGDRSGLFYEAGRIINEVRPQGFVLENVPGIYPELPKLFAYFAKGGVYELQWFNLSSAQLGGCHKRERVFIVGKLANPDCKPRYTSWDKENKERTKKISQCSCSSKSTNRREVKSRVCDCNDGFPRELAGYLMSPEKAQANIKQSVKPVSEWTKNDGLKLKALGNAVTPQQAYVALRLLNEWINHSSK